MSSQSNAAATPHSHVARATAYPNPLDFSCILEAEEIDLHRRYQHDNPRYVSFVNTDTRTRPIDEQITESELERNVHAVDSRISARKAQLLRSLRSQPLPMLPAVPHTFELRQQRDDLLRKALTVTQSQPFVPLGDLLVKEVALTEEARSTPPHMVADLVGFYRSRVEELPRRQLRYLERWATFGARAAATVQAQQLEVLGEKLSFLSEELSFSRAALSRAETYQTCLRAQVRRNEAAPPSHSASPAVNAANSAREFNDDAQAQALGSGSHPLEEIRPEDIAVLFNVETTKLQLRRRVDRFIAQAQVVPMAKRYAIYEATVHMLATGGELGAPNETSEGLPSVFAAASGIPTLAADDAAVLTHLEDIAGCFKLTGHDRTDIQEFVYNANKRYTAVFAAQCEGWSFSEAPQIADALSGVTADDSSHNKPRRGGKVDEDAIADSKRAYLRQTTWTPMLTISVDEPEWLAKQRATLNAVGKPHEVLAAECAFLGETDLLKTQSRWREVSSRHMQRATARSRLAAAAADGDVEAAAAAMGHTQGNKGANSTAAQSLTSQRLNALYQLRYVRIRELRRKILANLNYLASVQRKIALDCKSWTFPSPNAHEGSEAAAAVGEVAAGLVPEKKVASEEAAEAARAFADACCTYTGDDRVPLETLAKQLVASLDAGTAAAAERATNQHRSGEVSAEQFAFYCAGDGYVAAGSPGNSSSHLDVVDAAGRSVMYRWALDALASLEADMLRIATFFLARYSEAVHDDADAGEPDYLAVLEDAYESEAFFIESRIKVLDAYREAYSHCTDRAAQTVLAQCMLSIIERRPRIDFDDDYFAASYTNEHIRLELEHTLLREMLSSLVVDARGLLTRVGHLPSKDRSARFGFPDGRATSDASGYTPLFPSTSVVGLLELLPGLEQIAVVPQLMDGAAHSLLERFNLGRHVAAHHFVGKLLLEELIVAWRLLGEEDRVSRQAHHGLNTAAATGNASPARGGKAPNSGAAGSTNAPAETQDLHACVLDDPVHVSEVVREAADDAAFQSPSSATAAALGTKAGAPVQGATAAGPGDRAAALVLPELSSRARAWSVAVDVLRVRSWLVSALYRTELLYNVHRLYATGMGVSVKKSQLEPADFESRRAYAEIDAVDPAVAAAAAASEAGFQGSSMPLLRGEGNGPSTAALVVPFDCEYLPHLAIAEFDAAMARFDFSSGSGLKKVLSFGTSDLRRALTVQATQQAMVTSVVLCNQSSLDAHVEVVLRQRWLRELRNAAGTGSGERKGSSGQNPALAQRNGWVSRISNWPAPDAGEDVVDRVTLQRMYVSVNQIKSVHRKCILAEMAGRSAEGLDSKKPELLRRMMRSLKEQLLTEYCTNLLAATYQYAARAECALLGAKLRHIALEKPQCTIFTIGGKQDPVRPQPRSAQSAAQGDARRAATCIVARNGRFEDPRYIPHICQLATLDLEPNQVNNAAAGAGGKNTRLAALDAGVTKAHEHAHTHHQSHTATNFALVNIAAVMYHWLAIHRLAAATASATVPPHIALANDSAELDSAQRDIVVRVSTEIDAGLTDPTDPSAVVAHLADRHGTLFLRLCNAAQAAASRFRSDGHEHIAALTLREVRRTVARVGSCRPSLAIAPWLSQSLLRAASLGIAPEERHVPPTLGLLGRLHSLKLQPQLGIEGAVQQAENTPTAAFVPPVHAADGLSRQQFGVADFFDDLFQAPSEPLAPFATGPLSWLQPGFLLHMTADERTTFSKEVAKLDAMVEESADDSAAQGGATNATTAQGSGADTLTEAAASSGAALPTCSALISATQHQQMTALFRVIASVGVVTASVQAPLGRAAGQPPGAASKAELRGGHAVSGDGDQGSVERAPDHRRLIDEAALEELVARVINPAARTWAEREANDRSEQARRTGGGRRRNQVTAKDFRRLHCAVMLSEAHKALARTASNKVQAIASNMDIIARRLEAGELAAQHGNSGAAAEDPLLNLSGGAAASGRTFAEISSAIGAANPVSKEALFSGFLRLIMSRAVCVRDEATMYHVPEASLASALEVTGARLAQWQTQTVKDTAAAAQATNAVLLARIADLEAHLQHSSHERDVDRKAVARRVQAGIADGNYALLFQNDALRKENRRLKERIATAEEAMRHEVRAEYEGRLAELQRELLATQGQYRSYQRRLYRGMQVSLEEIKRDAMLSVGRMESAPLHMKRQALKIAISDDELNSLREQNAELRQTVAKTKLWYEMRLLRQKAAYEARMETMTKSADESRTAFWGTRELHDRERDTLKQQLVSAQGSLAQAEIEVDQLRRDLQMQLANKKELVSSKVKQAKSIETLTRRLKKFERFGQHDLDAIVSDFERRQQQLQNGEGDTAGQSRDEKRAGRAGGSDIGSPRPGTAGSVATGVSATTHSRGADPRELSRLKDLLNKERAMKEQAFAKVDELRQGNPDASESLVWQRKFYEAASELQRAIKEVESMRAALIQHGVSPPVVTTAASASAKPAPGGSASLMRGFHSSNTASLPGVTNHGASSSSRMKATPPASRLGSRASTPATPQRRR